MNFKMIVSGLLVGCSFAAAPGCAVEGAVAGAEGEDVEVSQDELNAAASRLVGAFHGSSEGLARSFQDIVFLRDGSFFADVDAGARVEGTFTATSTHLTLSPKANAFPNAFHGRYAYRLVRDSLTVTRAAWGTWKQPLARAVSYCAQPVDCEKQELVQVRCMGHWTCSAESTCGYKCGPAPEAIWPASATKLVAESPGGGFVPPPPPGSTCSLGAQKFALDVATKKLTWEVCDWQDNGRPLHPVRGSRKITPAQYAAIDAAMRDVKLATEELCGADKPFLQLKVTTPAGQKEYTDSFYSCRGGDRAYVDNIDGVFIAFRAATGTPD